VVNLNTKYLILIILAILIVISIILWVIGWDKYEENIMDGNTTSFKEYLKDNYATPTTIIITVLTTIFIILLNKKG